ncbi:MAG: pentapeptide repeat-containing protein [Bacteriovoracaceae bacterium]|nr:pentapeptide repeat-containing protein [Bacteriovoracaceae bacterium]
MKTARIPLDSLIISGTYAVVNGECVNQVTFENMTISGALLVQSEFHGCVFQNCTFYSATLDNCTFIGCRFVNCQFFFTRIEYCRFNFCSFENCVSHKGGIYGNDFSVCQLDTDSCDTLDLDNNGLKNCFVTPIKLAATCG